MPSAKSKENAFSAINAINSGKFAAVEALGNLQGNRAVANIGKLGGFATSLLFGAIDVATADDKGRAASGVAGSLAGAVAGAKLGTAAIPFLGPFAIFVIVGTALLGGFIGERAGEAAYDGIVGSTQDSGNHVDNDTNHPGHAYRPDSEDTDGSETDNSEEPPNYSQDPQGHPLAGWNPEPEDALPEVPDDVPFGELGLYGRDNPGENSDSESSDSDNPDTDVGHSIDLDAFGGPGEDVDSGQDGDGGPDGGDPGGGDPGGKPIVLDLDGDGLELVALEESTAFYDLNGDGYRERAAWASADDGFLAYDKDGDGAITDHDELSFVSYVEGARTDLEGLAHFDTNDNGELDSGDADWSKFRVWQDLDQDGESDPGELRTLTEAGISSISLTSDGVERSVAGNTVFGEGSYAHTGGSRSFFDVALQHSRFGFSEDEDGNITIGTNGNADLYIAAPTEEAVRTLDAATLGVAGIVGHDTADRLTAAPDGNLLAGAGGDDVLTGGAGDDWLDGGEGADTLRGGAGSDVLFVDADDFSSGAVDGGEGFDVAFYEGKAGIGLDLAAHGLEAIRGGGGNDRLSTSGAEGVVLFGEGGDDELTGGTGDDLLSGGAGADAVRGGDGNDILIVDSNDFADGAVDGGAGFDIAFVEDDAGIIIDLAAHGLEAVFGGTGNDTLTTTGTGAVALDGGRGDDTLTGGDGDDRLFGSAGDDTLTGNGGDDVLDGGAGTDRLEGGAGDDLYRFGRGDGRDTIRDEHLVNGSAMQAGERDTLFLHGSIGVADIMLRIVDGSLIVALKDPNHPDVAFDDLTERVAIENWSNAYSQIEVLAFGDGSLLDLKELVRTYRVTPGGAAVDLIAAMNAAHGATLRAGGNAYLGGAGDDRLAGGAGDDVLKGNAGNDALAGLDGADTLEGGLGEDRLHGGSGDDRLEGGAGDDVYSFGRGGGRDTIRDEHLVGGTASQAGTADTLYLGGGLGIADIVLKIVGGSLLIALKDPDDSSAAFDALADRVTIENWSNAFSKIEAIAFGDGSRLDLKELVTTYNVTDGGAAVDPIAAMNAAHGATLPEGGNAYLGGAGDDRLTGGAGDDVLKGNAGADGIYGGAGTDTLYGGAGDDTLYGGAGADTMKGGAGDDVYVFGRGDGLDTVREEHLVDGSAVEAGTEDTLFLRGGLGIADILLKIVGGSLVIALKDPDSPSAAFDDLADRVTIESWSNDVSKIEVIAFGDGSRLNLKELVTTYGVTAGGAAVDLIAAMNAAHGGTLPEGGNAYLGGAGDNVLVGGLGDDVLRGSAGADALYGGGGADTASFAGSTAGVTVDLAAGTASGGDAEGDTFSGIENLTGSDHTDRLTGDEGSNVLDGGSGNDTLKGGGGSDVYRFGRGQGRDAVRDEHRIDGTAADAGERDVLLLDNDIGLRDLVLRLSGGSLLIALKDPDDPDAAFNDLADRVTVENWRADVSKIEILAFGDGLQIDLREVVAAGGLTDGGAAVDLAAALVTAYGDGTTSNYTLYVGGAGDDALTGSAGADLLIGGEGGDTLAGEAGSDSLVGGAGDDSLTGGAGTDLLRGDAGNDVLDGGTGTDTLKGGAGDDLYRFGRGRGHDTIRDEHLSTEQTSRIEARTGYRTERFWNDSGEIGFWDERRVRHTYYVTLYDTIPTPADAGTDTLFLAGNLGIADILLNIVNGSLVIALKDPDDPSAAFDDLTDRVTIENWSNDFSKIEVLEFGDGSRLDLRELVQTYNVTEAGEAVDLIAAMNAAFGGTLPTGGYALLGGAGDDSLTGGDGDDVLKGGGGADTLRGGAGTDTATYDGSVAAVTVDLSAGTASGGDGEGDTLTDIENVTGSDHDDVLSGDANANRLIGGLGEDRLHGGGGDDRLEGGAGDDVYSFGRGGGRDTIRDEHLVGGTASQAGTADTLYLGGGLGIADIVLKIVGGSLLIALKDPDDSSAAFDALADRVTIENWSNAFSKIEAIAFGDGSRLDLKELVTTYNVTDGGAAVDPIAAMNAAHGATLPEGGNAYLGGAGDDRLTGGAGDDTLKGNAGADRIYGGAGTDTLYGGAGDDTLYGGAGADTMKGGAGDDVYAFGRGDGLDTVRDEHLVDGSAVEAGTEDTLFLRGELGIADILLKIVGGSLVIALKDPGSPSAAFDDLADRVTIESWSNDVSKIEAIAFGDGSRLNLKELVTTYGVTAGGAAVDLIAAMNAAHGGTLPEGGNAYLGGAGDDVLVGGTGNDVLEGKGGADALYGGGGIDTASYAGSSAGVTVDLAAGTASGGDAEGDTFFEIENLTGSGHNDTLTGDDGANRLEGGDGDDTLKGGAGNDLLDDGGGTDVLEGGTGNDIYRFSRGDGRDTIRDRAFVSQQRQRRIAYTAYRTRREWVDTGESGYWREIREAYTAYRTESYTVQVAVEAGERDVLFLDGALGIADIVLRIVNGRLEIALKNPDDPSAAFDDLADRITIENWSNGSPKIEVIAFGDGSRLDLRAIVLAYGVADGGAAVDLISAMNAAHGGTLPAGGNAYLGGAGNDILVGGDGDDVLVGGAGADDLQGGAGRDTVSYAASPVGVTVNLTAGRGSGGDAAGDRLSGVEDVVGSVHDDRLIGDANANRLAGGAGDDTLYGAGGDDTLEGGSGNDVYAFGRGDGGDTVRDVHRADGRAAEAGDRDVLFLRGDLGMDDIVLRIVGGSLIVALKDPDDPDAAFDDLTDRVTVGNWSNDLSKIEVLAFGDGARLDLREIVASGGLTDGGPAVDLTAAIAAVYGDGTTTGYTPHAGGDGDDVLTGGTGADVLLGGAGADILLGGPGADALNGGADGDTASYAGSSAGVTVDLLRGTGSGGDAEGDSLANVENVIGSDHDDALTGDAGVNHLVGGDGNDTLKGGAGADRLEGGAGNDELLVDAEDFASGSVDGGASFDTATFTDDVGATVDLGRHNLELVFGGDGADSFSQSGSKGVFVFAGGGDDTVSGGSGADYLSGDGDDDRLRGNGGSDSLVGGTGDDVYIFGRGDGSDRIDNSGESGSDDVVEFDSGIDADQLWFSRSGDDLVVRIVGTEDRMTVEDWYDGTDNRLDFELDDGRVLGASNVRALVDAMAAFTPPGSGETGFTAAQRTTLDPIVAANWQTPS